MNVKGNHVFKVSRERLWNYLMDPEVLAKITPGVSKLEVTGDDAYNTVSDIKIGPVKGAFKGKLNVEEKTEPASFAIKMEQLSKIGNAHAKINMRIEEMENGHSELFFDGNAKLSGMIARTGQRVLSGVANAITKEVFASLENHIDEDAIQEPVTEEIVEEKDAEFTVIEDLKVHPEPPQAIVDEVNKNMIGGDGKNIKVKPESTGIFSSVANFFKSIFKST